MFNKICKKTIYILCFVTFAILLLCSLLTNNNIVKDIPNIIGYLCSFIFTFIVFIFLLKLLRRINIKYIYIYIVYIVLIFVIPFILYKLSISMFFDDSRHILEFTLESLKGNYQQVFKGSYMAQFPWQYGLALFWTGILKFCSFFNNGVIYNYSLCIQILSFVQSLATSLSLFFGFLTVKRISQNNEDALFTYIFISVTCVPLFLYSLFIYNEVPCICFAMISIFFYVCYIQNNKLLNFILCVLFIGISIMLRFSAIIIAFGFTFVNFYYYLFEKKNIKKALISLLLLLIPFLISRIPYKYYETVSEYNKMVNVNDYKIDDGQPVILNIAMGLDIDSNKYGKYTGKNVYTYINECNMDSSCAVKKAKEQLSSSFLSMLSNPILTFDFFYHKTLLNWGDSTMGALEQTRIIAKEVDRSIVNFIYKGKSNFIINCFSKGQLILVNLLAILSLIKKRKVQDFTMGDYVFEIIVLGGFILSLFWETNNRYNFPYLYILILIGAINIGESDISKLIS